MNPNAIRVDRSVEDKVFAALTETVDSELVAAWGAHEYARQVVFDTPQEGGDYMRQRLARHYIEKGWRVNNIGITTMGDQARGKWRAIFVFQRPLPHAAPLT